MVQFNPMLDRNPFPGMNPWLESTWGDIHLYLISELRNQVAEQLPPGLFVKAEETVYLFHSEERSQIRPDVTIARRGDRGRSASGGNLAVAEPIVFNVPDDPITEGFLEVRALSAGHPVVTVIEVISPTNKLDRLARAAYLQKRAGLYEARVSVMELDLLRRGKPILGAPLETLSTEQIAPYGCCIRRYRQTASAIEYYPLKLRERLSSVPLPLREGDEDIVLDLQQPIDLAYRRGRYGEQIDYNQPPDPPLSPEDAAWAAEVLASEKRVPPSPER